MAANGVFCHHYSQQTELTSRFSLHITVRFGNKAQNAKFSAKEQHQKLHIPIVNFNLNICSKIKSLHLQQTSRSDLGI